VSQDNQQRSKMLTTMRRPQARPNQNPLNRARDALQSPKPTTAGRADVSPPQLLQQIQHLPFGILLASAAGIAVAWRIARALAVPALLIAVGVAAWHAGLLHLPTG
jgi:hypothetical protein